jgi:hypothetical protein
MDDLMEKTKQQLKVSYFRMMGDLYIELGFVIENQMELGAFSEIARSEQLPMNDLIENVFTCKVEDLPKYINSYGVFSELASWRLENAEAGLNESLEAAFGDCPGREGGIFDSLIKKLNYEDRMKAMNFTHGEATVLVNLFELHGMDEEFKIAQTLAVLLPQQVEGWD